MKKNVLETSHGTYNVTYSSFDEFLSATKKALERYEKGYASNNDLIQLGYAAQYGQSLMIYSDANPGRHAYETQEAFIRKVSSVVSDAQYDDPENNPFVGWKVD